jgi:hypothetical protein
MSYDPFDFDDQMQVLSARQRQELINQNRAKNKKPENSITAANTRAAEDALPKCPFCGRGVHVRFVKCKHCASDIQWVRGIPYRSDLNEQALKMEVNKRRAADVAAAKAHMVELDRRHAAKKAAERAAAEKAAKIKKFAVIISWFFAILFILFCITKYII